MTKRELKQIARQALIKENGYAPAYKEITLLEASGDGQWILFCVGGYEYGWDGITMAKWVKRVSK